MVTTFSTVKVALDEIGAAIQDDRRKLEQAKAMVSQAEADLAGLVSKYGAIVADIDAAAVATPGNQAIVNAKAEKDLLVAEFTALRATATSMKNALAAITV